MSLPIKKPEESTFTDLAAHAAGACLQIIIAAEWILLIVTTLQSKMDGEKCHSQMSPSN